MTGERSILRLACGALALLLAGCGSADGDVTTLRFWVMGREGEMVQELARDFERENPDIRVAVQQIPWSAAHEKLLTAFVGRATPDLAQLGNTWVPEFAALSALVQLDDLVAESPQVAPGDHFPGIWDTNVIDGKLFGVPWYVDTRVLFYRTDVLSEAGFQSMPTTWSGWREALQAVSDPKNGRYGILLPINEWTQPVIFGLQAGSPLLANHDTCGAFARAEFRSAFTFYVDLFRDGLAPSVANNEVANLYQEFERGTFAMYVTGPWNLGEFRHRLPAAMQGDWATAPLPAPDGQVAPGLSLAGGSSLVVFNNSEKQEAAWKLIEFLSQPKQQVRFFELTGDLPAHRAAWLDPILADDPRAAAFAEQLERVVPTPKIPEWEQIANRIWEAVEQVIRGAKTTNEALADLDTDVDRMLAKRRWLLAQQEER